MLVGIGSLCVNVALNLLLIDRMGIAGLALASSAALLLSGLALALLLRLRIGRMGMGSMGGQALRMLLAAAACGVLSVLAGRVLADRNVVLRILGAGAAPLALYAGLTLLLRVRSARVLTGEVLRVLRNRIGSGRKGEPQ